MLTGPTASEHAGVVEISTDLVVSITPIIGADSPSIRSLGNEANTVRITCVRRYSSLLNAMSARATFPRSLARSGQLLIWQDSLGDTLTIMGNNSVRLPSPPPRLIGRSVEFSFSFAVPLLTAAIA